MSFEAFLITAVCLILLISLLIVISTLQTGISPMPSSRKALTTLQALIEETHSPNLIDMGSGWGNVVIRLAKQYPKRQVYGYELSIIPWLVSLLLKKLYRLENLTLYRESFLDARLPNKTTMICYLCPELMDKLAKKLSKENHVGSYLISNTFALPSNTPIKQLKSSDFFRSPVYLYDLGIKQSN
jgi:hypothetical protein